MRISKKSEYGLIAMVHLARNKNKKAVSIRQISNIEGVPFDFLSKIFSALEKAGLINSKHGANGGYFLAKSSDKISVLDVIKLLENINTVKCGLCSKSKKCFTKTVFKKVDQVIGKTLSSIKLSHLIK
ncbi:MAG: Rrf2 family transcriptional regulator [Patescibacteria group bacterium]